MCHSNILISNLVIIVLLQLTLSSNKNLLVANILSRLLPICNKSEVCCYNEDLRFHSSFSGEREGM